MSAGIVRLKKMEMAMKTLTEEDALRAYAAMMNTLDSSKLTIGFPANSGACVIGSLMKVRPALSDHDPGCKES